MKAIIRNVLLACLISTFAFFGALGRSGANHGADTKFSATGISAQQSESRKETMTCLAVAVLAWGLCFWRCAAINRRINTERILQQRFSEYMRSNPYTGRQYR